MHTFRIAAAALAMLICFGCASTPKQEAAPREAAIDVRAAETLRRMSDHLKSLSAFTFATTSVVEQLGPDGQKLQFSRRASIAVRRPNGVHAISRGDDWNKEYVFDGKSITIIDRNKNVFSVAQMPVNIDEMFDTLAEKYGLSFPTCDLLYSDPNATLSADVKIGRYVGMHQVGDTKCHHLAFSQDQVDWQIWIEDGDQPWPRKLVVTYKNAPMVPQDVILFRDWKSGAPFTDKDFAVSLPADATRVELVADEAAR
ncbi:MAG: DUF2092 domain-containing protein [Phycisphaerales bacterium]|nr:DUF2092 domain-containing protein [Phycisphaerales bacterium]